MLLARALIVISFLLPALTAAADDLFARDRQLSELVLTEEELLDLEYEQRLAYLKFLMNLVAAVEDMHDLPAEEKSALLKQLHGVLLPEAHANTSSLVGQTCLNSLNAGQWQVNPQTNRLFCKGPAPVSCGGGQVQCAQRLTEQFAPSLGRVCITPPRAGESKGHTSRCVDAIAAKAGMNLDTTLSERLNSLRNQDERRRFQAFSNELRAGLKRFHDQRIGGRQSLREYCARRPNRAHALQPQECAAFGKLLEAFEVVTVARRNPYPQNSTAAAETPEVRQIAAQARAARPARDYSRPSGSGQPPEHAKDGKRGQPSAQPSPAPAPAPAPRLRPASQAPPIVAARPTTGSCEQLYHARLGPLACVACGMERVADAEIRTAGRGVANWVSLLGVMAQTYYGPYNTQSESGREGLQRRVMDMVASYGYCTDREYPADIGGLGDQPRQWIEGRAILRDTNSQRSFAYAYGMMSGTQSLFTGRPDNHGHPMTYAKEIFDDSDRRTGFDVGNVQERQWRFRGMIHAHSRSWPDTPFSQCARAVEGRLNRGRFHRMCPLSEGRWPNGATRIMYPDLITDRELAGNDALYGAMASSCGISARRRQPHRQCAHVCWGNFAYRQATSYVQHCDAGGIESTAQREGKPREPEGGRPSGKPGEPGRSRNTYGGSYNGGWSAGTSGGGGDGPGSGGTGSGGASGGGKGGESGSAR